MHVRSILTFALATLLATEMKALPCIAVAGRSGTSSPGAMVYRNQCNKPVAFVVEWSGSRPAHDSTYWMLPNETRSIAMYDTQQDIKGESEITFNEGPKGDVAIIQRHVPQVPSIDELVLLNHHHVRTLVQVELQLNFIPPATDGMTGKPFATKTTTLLVKPADNKGTVLQRFSTKVFASYTVVLMKAEDEPN